MSLNTISNHPAHDVMDIEQSNSDQSSKCKTRLLIGEGDLSFARALLKKHEEAHPNLASSITATELQARANHLQMYPHSNIEGLEEKGVTILFEIDAAKVDEHFNGKRFQRIHWNCPFGAGKDLGDVRRFRPTIVSFFQACSKIQEIGDRIHVTLMQEKGGNENWKRRQKQNPIVAGSSRSNYRLIRKRVFGAERYPGYTHRMTTTGGEHSSEEMREFIFEKAVSNPAVTSEIVVRLKDYQEEFQQDNKKFRDIAHKIKMTEKPESFMPQQLQTQRLLFPIQLSRFLERNIKIQEKIEKALQLIDPKKKQYEVKSNGKLYDARVSDDPTSPKYGTISPPDFEDYYFECSTDDDSSDYEDCPSF